MNFSSRRLSTRVIMTFLLLPYCGYTAGDSARGALKVSVTVLPSCEVRLDGGASNGVPGQTRQGHGEIAVACSVAFPFRVTLVNRATEGVVESNMNDGYVFSGTQRVDLSRLLRAAGRGVAQEITSLTISY